MTYALLVFISGNNAFGNCGCVRFTHALGFGATFFGTALAIILLLLLKVKFPHHLQAWHSYLAGSFSLIGSQIFTYIAAAYFKLRHSVALMFR